MTRLNRKQLAERRGTTTQAMGALLKRHGLKSDAAGKFDVTLVDEMLDGAAVPAGEMTLAEATTRKAAALAKLREFELSVRSGRFVRIEKVEQALSRLTLCLRSIVLTLPSKACAEAGENRREVFAAAGKVQDEILRQLAGVTDSCNDATLCSRCTAKISELADKYQFEN